MVTPSSSYNILDDFFNYSYSERYLSEVKCIDTSNNNVEVTNTNSLSIGDHEIKCEIIQTNDKNTSKDITIGVNSCYTFNSTTGMITKYNKNNAVCSMDVIIPTRINTVSVKHVGPGSFIEPTEQWCDWYDEEDGYQEEEVGVSHIHNDNDGFEGCWFRNFQDINKITSVDFSNAKELESIGYDSFIGYVGYNYDLYEEIIVNNITNITFGGINKLKSIGEYAFFSNKLSSLAIPASVEIIGEGTFSCNQLISIIIPNGVVMIDGWAFSDNQLISVTIPSSVEIIEEQSFENNQISNLEIEDTVANPSKLRYIGYWAFGYNQLNSLTIPASVETIGGGAFYDNQLRNLTISNGVKEIEENAFSSNQLTTITIPNSVTTVGYYAFGYNLLTNINIGKHVKEIYGNPFSDNPTLETITVDTNNKNYKVINNAIYTLDGKTLIVGTKGMANNIESTVETIGENSFGGMGLDSVTIPSSVKTIEACAFCWGNQLSSVIIANNVQTIDEYAFANSGIENLTLPNKSIFIGCRAFLNNPLTNVINPYGLDLMGLNNCE